MFDGRGAGDAGRAGCKHEDGAIAQLWLQRIIGATVPLVAVIHLGVVRGIMMCPNISADWRLE